ncbi:unnamed protein product [Rhizophagus irregularis]|uniref:RRM domain-containing protein n=1 Tax=Rhizophagus irregularis TaxID=588596 RepID=A0A915ZEA3_9GLOM|nr:unnamed protein product [Rhizophagus irregularis]
MNASGRTRCRDPDTGNSKGYGFISYDKFDSSDAAIDAMNNGYWQPKRRKSKSDVRPPAVPPPMIGVRAQASPQQINTGIKRDKEFIILNKLQFVSDGLSKIGFGRSPKEIYTRKMETVKVRRVIYLIFS